MIAWFVELFSRRRREHEAYLSAIRALSDSQAKTAEMVMNAVDKITATQAKQIDAIHEHLSLFKTVEAPAISTMSGADDNRGWAESMGFPFEGSPADMARWIAEHDDD